MQRYLLTPSLFDSWRFYQLLDSKEKQDFLDSLLKKPITDPDSLANIKAGLDFEADVMKVCMSGNVYNTLTGDMDHDYARCIAEVADTVRGGLWQERVQFEVKFYGMTFLVYGKMDVVKRDFIFDIKRSKSYDLGKYQESVQHGTYMFGSKLPKFAYLISDETRVFREDYAMSPDIEAAMMNGYETLVDGILADADFRAAYLEHWKADQPRRAA